MQWPAQFAINSMSDVRKFCQNWVSWITLTLITLSQLVAITIVKSANVTRCTSMGHART